MVKEIMTFRENEIENSKFHCYKNPTFIKDVDIDNILISNKIYSGEKNYKYFIGYRDDDYKVKPFSIILPKTTAHVKIYDVETRSMCF